jgi:hypothetical protein
VAFTVIKMNVGTITPADLKLLCTRFRLNLYTVLSEYNTDHVYQDEAQIVAIMEAFPTDSVPAAINSFGIPMAMIATRRFPELALPIIRSKSSQSTNYYSYCMAEAIDGSAASQSEKDLLVMDIVKKYPASAADIAEKIPHLRFQIVGMVPRCAAAMARIFPDDAIELARLSPACAPDIAKAHPSAAAAIKELFTIKS